MRVTWALAVVVFAIGVDNYIVAAILPAIADDLLNTSAQNLGGVIGPALTGWVIASGGFALAGPYAAVIGLVALVIGWFTLPRHAREPATDVEGPLAES